MDEIDNVPWNLRIRPQPMFEILAKARKMEQQGRRVVHFEIGETSGFKNQALIECVKREAARSSFGYSPSVGEPILRSAVTNWLERCSRLQIKADNVAIAPANSLVLQTLAAVSSPNDYVLIPDPSFSTYVLAAEFLQLNIVRYRPDLLTKDTEELERLRALLKDKSVSAIVFCNPSNPTGRFVPWASFLEILDFCDARGIRVISDETYSNLILEDHDSDRVVRVSDAVIRIRSASKEFAAPGLRLGYVLAAGDVVESVGRSSSLTFSCLPSFLQIALATYLESPEPQQFIESVRLEMSDRFGAIDHRHVIRSTEIGSGTRAGFYTMLDVGDGDAFFQFALEKFGVATCPGSVFGDSSRNQVRLSLACDQQSFDQGLDLLEEAITDWMEM